ncbi:MAG TPA: phosphodiester glycosidase family protein [Aggregatilineales bacterium]|nr:phosphodiester glycosidase family protein [Aggregatilineales bacterium]
MPRRNALIVLAALLLAACGPVDPNVTPVVVFPTRISGTALPTFDSGGGGAVIASPTSLIPPTAGGVATSDTVGWAAINATRPGAYWRTFAYRNSTGATVNVLAARFDANTFTMRVHYFPGQALTIQQWKQLLPNAVAIINTTFFTPQNLSLGLIISDGRVLAGYTQRSDSGLFQVKTGLPKVRSLWLEPIVSWEQIEQAVQTYPILMARGQVAPINSDVATVVAARSVIAQDSLGRVYLIITGGSGTLLSDLGNWLGRTSGFGLQYALNLDGGGSTNLYLSTGGTLDYITGARGIPAVVAVYPR